MKSRLIELLCAYSGMEPPHLPPHPGVVGEVVPEQLWRELPLWKERQEEARPAPAAIDALRACRLETTLVLAFGTWCHLSRDYLPALLKAVAEAGNDRLRVRLVGLDDQFQEPRETIQALRLTNVPTLIVEQEGREVGRVVETPAAATLEEEVAAILAGRPRPHPGRWLRGPLAARGTYAYLAADGSEEGEERWEVYAVPEGGGLLRSVVETESAGIEAWLRLGADGRPALAELTQTGDGSALRSRVIVDGPRLTAWLRGDRCGNVRQSLAVPERFAFLPPAVAAASWGWLSAQEDDGPGTRSVLTYVAPLAPALGLGATVLARYRLGGCETVRLPVGELAARRLERRLGGETCECLLHPDLCIPLSGNRARDRRFLITRLETCSEVSLPWQVSAREERK